MDYSAQPPTQLQMAPVNPGQPGAGQMQSLAQPAPQPGGFPGQGFGWQNRGQFPGNGYGWQNRGQQGGPRNFSFGAPLGMGQPQPPGQFPMMTGGVMDNSGMQMGASEGMPALQAAQAQALRGRRY